MRKLSHFEQKSSGKSAHFLKHNIMEIVESFFLAEALLIVNLEEQTIQSF